MPNLNPHLVCIVGESAGGKSASLHQLKDPEGVLYLNCEAGKHLPFPSKFKEVNVTDPKIIPEYLRQIESQPSFHTVVIDTLTFMMEMFESKHVLTAQDTMKAWSNYAQFFKNMMQTEVAESSKNIIFMAHVQSIINEDSMLLEKKIPVKGQLAKNGIEAYFSTVIAAKKMAIDDLADYKNDLLNITPEEEAIGVKYVYQTKLTRRTVNERIRSSMGMWSDQETFIDNNAQLLMDRLHQYYGK
jgi:hypothetical protein